MPGWRPPPRHRPWPPCSGPGLSRVSTTLMPTSGASDRPCAMLSNSDVTPAGARGWLLDTNVISELRKGPRCDRSVAAWAQGVPPAACHLSRVTIAEIVFGIERVTDPAFRVELESWLRDGV